MIAAEFCATGSLSTLRFHGFDFGKTGQRGAVGRRSAWAAPPAPAMSVAVAAATRARVVMFRGIGSGSRSQKPVEERAVLAVDGHAREHGNPAAAEGAFVHPLVLRLAGRYC